MRLRRHPRFATLNRFADGELKPREHERVANHLAACGRCRKEVAFIREAGKLARSLETPSVPDDLMERIRARREAGERVILPLESPGAPRERWRTAVPAAAALVVLLAASIFFTGVLEADRPGLRFEPERPRAGDTLTVTYDGGATFSGLDHLRLRARFRTVSGRTSQQIAATLENGDDAVFRARVALPDSVVYAAFAVENDRADRVDHNNGGLWEVMVRGPDGRPTLDALTQRYIDLGSRWGSETGQRSMAARETVEMMTRLYPESPRGWWAELGSRRVGSAVDTVPTFYLSKFREIERRFADDPPADPDEYAYMAWFGSLLGAWQEVFHWTTVAEARGARGKPLAQAKLRVIVGYERLPPATVLAELEKIWQESPDPVPNIADWGWNLAIQLADWEAALRWLPRTRATRGTETPDYFLGELREAFGPDTAMGWALKNADLELLRTQAARPLEYTQAQYDRRLAAGRQRMLAAMAAMAEETDRPEMAEALALETVPLAWELDALRTAGSILLEAGDTANAVAAFARIAADPAGGPVPDIVRRAPGWAETLESTRFALIRYVMEDSKIQYLPPELAGPGELHVVAFLSECGSVASAVREIPGGQVTVYATAGRDSVQSALRACGLDLPVLDDPGQTAARAFGLKSYDALFVIDATGRIRFGHASAESLPRKLMALRAEGTALAD